MSFETDDNVAFVDDSSSVQRCPDRVCQYTHTMYSALLCHTCPVDVSCY